MIPIPHTKFGGIILPVYWGFSNTNLSSSGAFGLPIGASGTKLEDRRYVYSLSPSSIIELYWGIAFATTSNQARYYYTWVLLPDSTPNFPSYNSSRNPLFQFTPFTPITDFFSIDNTATDVNGRPYTFYKRSLGGLTNYQFNTLIVT